MTKKLVLFLLFIFNFNCFAQINGEDEVYLNTDVINPKFNGGTIDKFYEFVNKNFDFTKVTKTGKLVASFTITEQGDLKDIKVIQFVDVVTATEIIRVLKLSPKWNPALKNGKPTSVTLKLPLEFKTSQVEDAFKNKELAQKRVSDSLTVKKLLETSKDNGVETKPEFAGGISKFYKYISSNFNVPSDKNFKGGKLFVKFVVEKDGTLTDIEILKDIGYGTAQEAIRVIKQSPLWTPAMQKGKLVRCTFTLPITLKGN